MLQADILLVLLTAGVLTFIVITRTPKTFRDPPRHVLICCAHSDDCVITGAEYAYGAVEKGLSVRIAYLTCSATNPDTEIARIRKAEALAAWSTLGVPQENFIFMNLSASPVRGPLSYSDQDIALARELFKTSILSIPQNAAIIVPARGEYHVDHKTVRKLSLLAIADCMREDLIVYETPEYNAFLSLVHCPKRAIRAVLRRVPSLHRLVKPYLGPSNYVEGCPGFVFRDTPKRLAKKKELLRHFSSQSGDLLLRLFGYETLYRRLSLARTPRAASGALCVSAFGGRCDPSTLALALALLCATFLTAHEVARGLTTILSPTLPIGKYLLLLSGLPASAYVIRRFRRTVSLESSLFVWAATLGLILGAL